VPLDVQVQNARPVGEALLRLAHHGEHVAGSVLEGIVGGHNVVDRNGVVEVHPDAGRVRLVVLRHERRLFHAGWRLLMRILIAKDFDRYILQEGIGR
jgi:hypothetical protein